MYSLQIYLQLSVYKEKINPQIINKKTSTSLFILVNYK